MTSASSGSRRSTTLSAVPRYELPDRVARRRPDPQDALVAVLTQFGRRTSFAQNLVVVHSELGSAPAIARAIDQAEHERVVGDARGRRHVPRDHA